MRQYEVNDDKLCDIEASAKWYAKNRRETPVERGLSKVTNYFKKLDLLEVPSDKGNMFCIIRKSTYQTKLDQVHDCPQFSRIDASDDIKTKIEKNINRILLQMKNQHLISKKVYQKLQSTGAKPARLYGLDKVDKNDTALHPVIQILNTAH